MAIDWTATGAALQGIGSMLQAGAAVGLLYIGWRGLDAWRLEAMYQRRMDHADVTLVSCYQVADILRQMANTRSSTRQPIVLPRWKSEPTWLWHTREAFAISETVYTENLSAFQELRLHRYRTQAILDEAHAGEIDELQRIADWLLLQANSAVNCAMHIELLSEGDISRSNQELVSAKAELHEYRVVFKMRPPSNAEWWEQDRSVDEKIDNALRRIEIAFKSSIKK